MSPLDTLTRLEGEGASLTVAGRDAGNVPSVAVALGCRVEGAEVVVVLDRRHAREVLACFEDNGRIAIVSSRPSTHETLQLKGVDARVGPVDARDLAAVRAHRATLARDLEPIGFGAPFTEAMLAHAVDDLVAVRFEPVDAFDQTPGPRAGRKLERA